MFETFRDQTLLDDAIKNIYLITSIYIYIDLYNMLFIMVWWELPLCLEMFGDPKILATQKSLRRRPTPKTVMRFVWCAIL